MADITAPLSFLTAAAAGAALTAALIGVFADPDDSLTIGLIVALAAVRAAAALAAAATDAAAAVVLDLAATAVALSAAFTAGVVSSSPDAVSYMNPATSKNHIVSYSWRLGAVSSPMQQGRATADSNN